VTELKQQQRRQQLLIHELNHRVKNTLATVQSIAAQSLRGRCNADATEDFVSRLGALAGGHDLLSQENWTGASLRAVVTRALTPHRGADDERWTVGGPHVWLPARQALAMTLALHELSTNAAKYGALKSDSGHVDVAWELLDEGRAFRLTWRESGGPAVRPPKRKGFGSRLLERGLSQDLDGSMELDYRPDGIVCTVEAPVPSPAAPRELDLHEGC
jgi:two-component sensor histidine kinase